MGIGTMSVYYNFNSMQNVSFVLSNKGILSIPISNPIPLYIFKRNSWLAISYYTQRHNQPLGPVVELM